MKIFTIGFSKKDAKTFFELLEKNEVKTLVDVRLNNKSQLAGFTKVRDFPYFLTKLCSSDYRHEEIFAPTKNLLNGYKNEDISWKQYEKIYNSLLDKREILENINIKEFENSCFLCSEFSAENCHRRLAVEYLKKYFSNIEIVHL